MMAILNKLNVHVLVFSINSSVFVAFLQRINIRVTRMQRQVLIDRDTKEAWMRDDRTYFGYYITIAT